MSTINVPLEVDDNAVQAIIDILNTEITKANEAVAKLDPPGPVQDLWTIESYVTTRANQMVQSYAAQSKSARFEKVREVILKAPIDKLEAIEAVATSVKDGGGITAEPATPGIAVKP